MINNLKVVALIPARSGSKKVINKNIRLLNNKPLIAYSIEAALNSKYIDRTIVSTDSEHIANIAKKFNAEVPFIRPAEIALDNTPDLPVMKHLVYHLHEKENYSFELLIYLRPTTPLKTSEIIDNCIEKFINNNLFTSLRTVCLSTGIFHPYWMYKPLNDTLTPFVDKIKIQDYFQRQLLPACYRLNGLVDVIKTDMILNNPDYFGTNIGFFETSDHESIDIDTEFDFELCEFILNK